MKIRFKILILIIISYFVSDILGKNIFLANTPKIRPDLSQYLLSKIIDFKDKGKDFFASLFNFSKENYSSYTYQDKTRKELEKRPLIELYKGVYAQTEGKKAIIKIDIGEMEFTEYVFNIDGREIKLKIPKNGPTPPPNVLRKMY